MAEDKVREKGEGPPVEAVPQVVQAIGQISNYFGSTPAQSSGQPVAIPGQQLAGCPAGLAGQPKEQAGRSEEPAGRSEEQAGWSEEPAGRSEEQAGRQVEIPGANTEVLDTGGKSAMSGAKVSGHVTSQHENTAIGLLSHEDIGRLAGEIALQFREGEEEGEEACKEEAGVPSYAPEKCITGYAARKQEPGKGSPLPITTLPIPEAGGSVRDAEVSKLEGMLVSEKDIFGAILPEDDTDDDEGEGLGGDVGEGLGGDKGEGLGHVDMDMVDCGDGDHGAGDGSHGDSGEPIKLTLSQAEMMEEFKKLTSLSQDKLSKCPTYWTYLGMCVLHVLFSQFKEAE